MGSSLCGGDFHGHLTSRTHLSSLPAFLLTHSLSPFFSLFPSSPPSLPPSLSPPLPRSLSPPSLPPSLPQVAGEDEGVREKAIEYVSSSLMSMRHHLFIPHPDNEKHLMALVKKVGGREGGREGEREGEGRKGV